MQPLDLFVPALLLLPLVTNASQWQKILPGPPTLCSDNSPYSFFVRAGDPTRLVVELQGGGCCFSSLTCKLPQYTRSVDLDTLSMLNHRGGIGDHSDPRNPVAGWTHVFVPYCTGDAHMGNQTTKYGRQVVHHRGRVNAHTALGWAFEQIQDPSVVLTVGISAGAVGTYTLAPFVMSQYSKAKHYQLADSYAPLFGEAGYNGGMSNWDSLGAYAPWIAGLSPDILSPWRPLIAAYGLNITALTYLNATFATYVSNGDVVEKIYYLDEGCADGGQEGCRWTSAMRDAIDAVHQYSSNFASFIGPGSRHSAVDKEFMYEQSVSGTSLADWLRDMVNGKQIDMRVDCKPYCS